MVTKSREPKPPTKSVAVNTDAWLTRLETASVLGVSENTIANWQRQKLLKPEIVLRTQNGQRRGVFVYNPREFTNCPVRRVNARLPGEVAARAFEMFDNGHTQRAVVVATHEEPDKIEELHSKWLDMGGADAVITPEAKDELERLVGPFGSVAALIAAVRRKVESRDLT